MQIKLTDSLLSVIGVVCGQLLFFLCLWFIGLNFGASQLGEFNLHLSIGMFLGTIFVFRYELACISNSQNSSLNATSNVYLLSLIVTLILLLFSFMLYKDFSLTIIFSLSFLAVQTFINYLNSQRKYVYIGFFRVIINFCFLLFILFLYFWHYQDNLFEVYTALYFCLSFVLLAFILYKQYKSNIRLNFKFFIKENYRYPLYIFPATCCSSIYTYSLSILIPFWYGLSEAGYFAVAYKFGFFPIALLSQSISGVFRRDMLSAVEISKKDAENVYKVYMKYIFIASILYCVFGYLFSEWIITLMFGEKWGNAVIYYKLMIPLFCIQLLYSPASQLFLVFKKQKIDFIVNFLLGITLVVLFIVNYFFKLDVVNLIILFVCISSFILVCNLYITYRIVFKNDRIYY
ncbi:oligosaccharide flippase family protein [Orbus sasakiae]|uniref:Oligosaccharide flippase family protein n=1 Tax=Orbus sasakiae TaxID=1078475 RepID=A0ABP9NCC9_9GAMM